MSNNYFFASMRMGVRFDMYHCGKGSRWQNQTEHSSWCHSNSDWNRKLRCSYEFDKFIKPWCYNRKSEWASHYFFSYIMYLTIFTINYMMRLRTRCEIFRLYFIYFLIWNDSNECSYTLLFHANNPWLFLRVRTSSFYFTGTYNT